MLEDQLAASRQQIDAIDHQLLSLLNQRAELALNIGSIKQKAGEVNYYHPHREQQLLNQLQHANTGPLTQEDVLSIFKPILAACRSLQQPVSVALLGPENTYSHLAACQHFGEKSLFYFQPDIQSVLSHLEKAPTHYGILPIYNSTTGLIENHLNQLLKTSLSICGEIKLPIQHCLLCKHKDAQPEVIYAHQQSLLQCQHRLAKHYPHSRYISVASNALAAKHAADDPQAAAIASQSCAKQYGLNVIAHDMADDPNNQTTFWVVSQQPTQMTGSDKTVLLVYCQDQSGNLSALLAPFAKHQLNLSHLSSQAITHPNWQYRFYIEVMAHQQDPAMRQAIQALTMPAYGINVLGSFACQSH